MPERKIDELRHRVAEIGKRQAEYHRFFPDFADRVAVALGEFLGDPSAVALTVHDGEFSFDHPYRHEGVDFDCGFYRIPIMVRVDNLEDEGALLVRFRLFCELRTDRVSVAIEDGRAFEVDCGGGMEKLCGRVFEYLCKRLSEDNFIDSHHPDYRSTSIGFRSTAAQHATAADGPSGRH